MRARYPFKEDLLNSPGKWTSADEAIQYLRELAVLEIVYSNLGSDNVPKDPEDVPCTQAMWRKVFQSTPASYSNNLVALYYLQMDTPAVEVMSSWLWNIEETLGTSTSLQGEDMKKWDAEPTSELEAQVHELKVKRDGILEGIMDWPEGRDFGALPEKVTHQEAPPYNKLPENERGYSLFRDGSYHVVGNHQRWKAAV
ncbi:hypothetical protein BTVI_41940 [Pitangus sulphuratus]|nr:hypothetical protein BTVI_41940 [Pitangus sulphuratus]